MSKDKKKYTDVEAWASRNCDIDLEARAIMAKRIERVTAEMREEWSDAEKKRRAGYLFFPPYTIPEGIEMIGWERKKMNIPGER